MSTTPRPNERPSAVTTRDFVRARKDMRSITMVTAYDYTFSRIVDSAGVDGILVGDSLGNVIQGHHSTIPVCLDDVIYHTSLVARGAERALVVGDLPFGSYHVSPEHAVGSAVRLMKEGGAAAVKLEGGVHVRSAIERIVRAEIPVMGHVGLTPQAIHRMGGHRVQGRGARGRQRVLDDADAVQDAGAFSVVLEGMPEDLAAEITERLEIPTIGIGAGRACVGQILVLHDLLGLTEWTPTFVKRYADLGQLAAKAVRQFTEEVAGGKFPDAEHSYR